MCGNEILTIRPKLHEGESLLNYLIRVANANGITNILDLWHFLKKESSSIMITAIYSYKLDLYPSDIISIIKLGGLLGKSENELRKHSFEPILSLFYPSFGGKVHFGKEIEREHRRFCRKCLEENGVYKLLWQVKEIEICEKHLIRITSQCINCGYHQPYQNKKHLDQLICDNCGEILYNNTTDTILSDNDFIQNHLRIYRDWKFIFDDLVVKGTHYFQNPKRIHNQIAILLLFLTTPQKGKFSYKKHPFFTLSQAYKLVRLARNESENEIIKISFILNTLRNLKIELKDVVYQKIPFSFYKFILNKKVKNKIHSPNCKSHWCKYYGTSVEMKDMRVFSKGEYIPKTNLYNPTYVCTNCCVQIGFNKKSKQWEEINISYPLLKEIKKLYNRNLSIYQIKSCLKISYYKVYYYLGYIARFQQNDIKKLNKNIVDNEILIKNFNELKSYWRDSQKLAQKAASLFGWNAITTYYYFWHPVVQELIYIEQNQRKFMNSNSQIKVNKMGEAIEQIIESDSNLSLKEVAATLNVTENQLRYFNLNEKVINKKYSRVLSDKNEERAIILESIAVFINNKREHKQQIFAYEIYKFIGRSRKYIKSHFPDIEEQISNLAKESNSKQKEMRKGNLIKVIMEVYKEYGQVDKNILSQHLGISVRTLKSEQGIYKGLGKLIRQTISEFEQNK